MALVQDGVRRTNLIVNRGEGVVLNYHHLTFSNHIRGVFIASSRWGKLIVFVPLAYRDAVICLHSFREVSNTLNLDIRLKMRA